MWGKQKKGELAALLVFPSGARDRTPHSELAGGQVGGWLSTPMQMPHSTCSSRRFLERKISTPSSQQLTSIEHTPFSAKFTSFYLEEVSQVHSAKLIGRRHTEYILATGRILFSLSESLCPEDNGHETV